MRPAKRSCAEQQPEVLAAAALTPMLLERLRAEFTVHEHMPPAAEALRIRAVVAHGGAKVPRALLEQLPALEVIVVFGVGYDGVDVAAAREHGIPVTNTPDVLNDDVADLGIGLLLALARRIPQADRYVRAGRWPEGPLPLTRKVSGAWLGILGLGRIGQAIARRAEGFGLRVAYTARAPKADCPYLYCPSAAALAAQVDYLIVCAPGGEETRGLVGAEVLAALGPEGCLINVARGSVVDQPALLDALWRGAIAGAALDVFADEPHVPPALRELDNVVLTPHMASATRQTRQAMTELVLDNLRAHFAGRPLLTPV